MAGTILGPGTIFLMLVGSMSTALHLGNVSSMLINGSIVCSFILIGFWTQSRIQILTLKMISTFYACMMLTVIVATVIEIFDEGLYQPSSIFFISLCMIFSLVAMLHPSEFSCVFHLLLYLLCIPSMYLFSTLYSIINLNNISWGVRDEAPEKGVESENEPKRDEFKSFKRSNRILAYLRRRIISFESHDDVETGTSDTCTEVDVFEWMNVDTLKNFSRQKLDQEEALFWKEFIKEYLLPLDKDKVEGEVKAKQLINLRNTIAFWFGILNGLFILLVLLIEGNQEYFNYSFNLGSSKNDNNENLEIDKHETKLHGEDVLHIDFIGMILISVFGSILLIQVFGMLRHRLNTFLFLIASTDLNPCNKKQVRIEVN